MKTDKNEIKSTESTEITKSDVKKAAIRWITLDQACWNYETMQSAGVIATLGPLLKKIYGNDKEKLKKAYKKHFQFFNTNPITGGLVMGAALAIEEKQRDVESDTVNSIKTGLMGPLAGVGDAVFFVIPLTVFGAMAAYMGQSGSPLGILIGLLFGTFMLYVRYKLFDIGYVQGTKFITSLSGQLKNITTSASILGLTVVGALIPSTVKATVPFVIVVGKAKTALQSTLDMIMPNLIPALLVLLVYWLLGKKKMTSTKIIIMVIIFSIICYSLQILK